MLVLTCPDAAGKGGLMDDIMDYLWWKHTKIITLFVKGTKS